MFVFACPIIAKSQCWVFAPQGKYGANICIGPNPMVATLTSSSDSADRGRSIIRVILSIKYPNSTSGICAVVSKYKER